MASRLADVAVSAALERGQALLKHLSPNDCGATRGHQCGIYLPKSAWQLFAPWPPKKGVTRKHEVEVSWQGGEHITKSAITWYGRGTRDEYRLTRFGKRFRYLSEDAVGSLLVLVPAEGEHGRLLAYVLEDPGDAEEVMAALGVQTLGTYAIFGVADSRPQDAEDQRIEQELKRHAEGIEHFPSGDEISRITREVVGECVGDFESRSADERLMKLLKSEFRLFTIIERHVCGQLVCRAFKNVDDFISTALSILNRRKSRAGRALENHVAYVLRGAGISCDVRPAIQGEPDILIPGKDAYDDREYPEGKLFAVAVKTTCKDRWRQVIQEAPRAKRRYLVTIQEGISASQLQEMASKGIRVVVPKELHVHYPKVTDVKVLGVQEFIHEVRQELEDGSP